MLCRRARRLTRGWSRRSRSTDLPSSIRLHRASPVSDAWPCIRTGRFLGRAITRVAHVNGSSARADGGMAGPSLTGDA